MSVFKKLPGLRTEWSKLPGKTQPLKTTADHILVCWYGHNAIRLFHDQILLLLQPFYGSLSRTTQVSQYQKKHSPTHTYPDHQSSFISFLHLLWSIASSLFNLVLDSLFAQPLSKYSLVYPLGLAPSISYSIHFFNQSPFSFHNIFPYIATCFDTVARLYHLILVLSLYLELYPLL